MKNIEFFKSWHIGSVIHFKVDNKEIKAEIIEIGHSARAEYLTIKLLESGKFWHTGEIFDIKKASVTRLAGKFI